MFLQGTLVVFMAKDITLALKTTKASACMVETLTKIVSLQAGLQKISTSISIIPLPMQNCEWVFIQMRLLTRERFVVFQAS